MAAVLEQQTKRWTYEDYYRLDDDQRYEIIDGELIPMSPSPGFWHQAWVSELHALLHRHVKERKLGTMSIAPLDVILDSENTVQPDLIFVSNANSKIIQPRGIFGTPDLVVELLSPSTSVRDRHAKNDLYARFGVKEYWIGDPANQTLEILVLRKGRYELHCSASVKGKITSLVMPELEFDLAEIQ